MLPDLNLIGAITGQEGIPDRNLPTILHSHIALPAQHYTSYATVMWSSVSLVPSFEDRRRNVRIQMLSSIDLPMNNLTNHLSVLTFVIDLSNVDQSVLSHFDIGLNGPLEGYVTMTSSPTTHNALEHVTYDFILPSSLLILDIIEFPRDTSWTAQEFLYMDIIIKDRYIEQVVPILPVQVAQDVLRMPAADPDERGRGIRIVLPMNICCPDELRTMQITEMDPNAIGAFNCRDETDYLLVLQNVDLPYSYIINVEAVEDYPEDMEQEPMEDWRTSTGMRHMCLEIQSLVSTIPECTIIILYSYFPVSLDRQPYLSWLRDNTILFDMFVTSQPLIGMNDRDENEFLQMSQALNECFEHLHDAGKHLIVCEENSGNNRAVTFPSPYYSFERTNIRSIVCGGFIRGHVSDYDTSGPYTASTKSAGGYCNRVLKPFDQFGVNYSPQYGCPDVAGYFGPTIYCLYPNTSSSASGCSFTVQPLAALFARIMNNTRKTNWEFKYILYRKASSFVVPINDGNNTGSVLDSTWYLCKLFPLWDPVCGLGNIRGDYLYRACDFVKTNTIIQISSYSMNHNVAFLQIMPRNTFADLLDPQPVFGFSSLFSLFGIFKVNPDGRPPSTESTTVLTNSLVYFVNSTTEFALSYGVDSSNKLYVFVQKFNHDSVYQQWMIKSHENPDSVFLILGFDRVTISPALYNGTYLSSLFNANQSLRPNAPSISNSKTENEVFILNHDPHAEEHIDVITQRIDDDTASYSYYVNFTYSLLDGTVAFLNNPEYFSFEGDTESIYESRAAIHNGQAVVPRWGPFSRYPQWLLVPVLPTSPGTFEYQSTLDINSSFMIYNTILQSYLYLDVDQEIVAFHNISASTTDTIAFTQFLFDIRKKGEQGEIFSASIPNKPGFVPSNILWNIFQTNVSVYSKQMRAPFFNGLYDFYVFGAPVLFGDPLTVQRQLDVPSFEREYLVLYWVFKKFIMTMGRSTLFLVYNDEDSRQENEGLFMANLGDASNVNGNAPSLQVSPEFFTSEYRWKIRSTTTVNDSSFPSRDDTMYIILDENLKQVGITALTILSATQEALSNYGPDPQPTMVSLPFDVAPDAVRWSATRMNRFDIPPRDYVRRSNYMYMYTTYSFYSWEAAQGNGFLSSFRMSSQVRPPGWAPSIFVPDESFSRFQGNPDTIFSLL